MFIMLCNQWIRIPWFYNLAFEFKFEHLGISYNPSSADHPATILGL